MRHRVVLSASLLVLGACSGAQERGDVPASTTGVEVAATEAPQIESTTDDTTRDTTDETTGETTIDDEVETTEEPPAPSLDWMPCEDTDGLECATLAVPLDHDAPDGEMIDLALARQAVSDPSTRIGSLVFNPGGPGGSGVEHLAFARFAVPEDVASRFDLVSFDPRGVGASASVDCDLGLDDGIMLVGDDDRAAWDALLADTTADLGTCEFSTDQLGRYVGTNNTARDLDLIRAALGDEQLSYVGFSYGTRLGATYAEMYPERVRALVLDGAVKPTTELSQLAADQGAGFDQAFENFAAACDADTDCLLRELGPTVDVVQGIRAEIAEVGAFATDDPDRVLTAGELELGIIASLYSKDAWPFLAQAIYLADTVADGSLFQVLADGYLGRGLDGNYSNQTEANAFINCADDASRPDADAVWESADATADRSTYFASALRATAGCLGHDAAVDPLLLGPATGAAPILVIGTTGDPATPYDWSVEMADSLDSGVLYTVEGEGHTAYLSIDCVSDVVADYLIDLMVPDDGGRCADDAGSDFFVPAGESEIELIVAFFDCAIAEGAPLEPITIVDVLADPLGEELLADLDLGDPAVVAAFAACQSLLSF